MDFYQQYSFCILTDPQRYDETKAAVARLNRIMETLSEMTGWPGDADPELVPLAELRDDPVFGGYVSDDHGELTVDEDNFNGYPTIVVDDPTGLTIYDGTGDAGVDIAAECAQWLLIHAPVKGDEVEFEWADTGSKPRPGSFGGGAVLVRRDGWTAINTGSLFPVLRQKLAARAADRAAAEQTEAE